MPLPDWFWDGDGSPATPTPVGTPSSWTPGKSRRDAKAINFALCYGPIQALPGRYVAQGSFTNATLHTDNLIKALHDHGPPKKKVAVTVLAGGKPMQMMMDVDQYEKLTKELKRG